MNKDKLAKYSFYLWLLAWPWQTKLILTPSLSNYLEISIFLSWIFLIIPIVVWAYSALKKDYWRFEKDSVRPVWWYGLIILEAAFLISLPLAINTNLAFYHYIILVIALLIFYILKTDKIEYREFFRFFIGGLISPALLGIWQFFSQSTFSFKWLGLASHPVATLGTSVVEAGGLRYLRAYGSFDHPNVLGGVMVVGLLFILYFSFKNELSKRSRLFYLLSSAIFYCALLVSFSRSALIALVITAPLLFLKFKKPARNLLIAYSCLIILISIVIVVPYKDLFLVRSTASGRLEQKSLTERTTYMEQAWSLIKIKPLQGVGAGNYILALPGSNQYSQPVHNYWLLLWSEVGLFGLLGALIFWLYLSITSYSKNLYPLVIALFIFSLLDHWLLSSGVGIMLFFTISALLTRKHV